MGGPVWPRRGRPSPGRGGRDSVSGRWAGDGRGAVSPGLGSGARTGRTWPSADISAPKRRTLHSKCETGVLSKKTLCSAFCYFFPEMKSALVTVLDIHRALHYCLVVTPGFLMKFRSVFSSPLTGHLRRVKTLLAQLGSEQRDQVSFAERAAGCPPLCLRLPPMCPVADPGVLNRYPRPGSFS